MNAPRALQVYCWIEWRGIRWTYQHNVLDLFQAHGDSAALLNLWVDVAVKRIRSADQSGQEDVFANGSQRLICKMEMEILLVGSSKCAD
jgi:hypothetical protein